MEAAVAEPGGKVATLYDRGGGSRLRNCGAAVLDVWARGQALERNQERKKRKLQ